MGIPIGKLQLYTACAAVPPQYLLPVHIDFGTNNRELLDDPLYLGLRQPRVSTAERDGFVEEFVRAIQEVFPGCCLHFEDWAGVDAMRLLARYRDRVCCYNDDIQGTAGVALAGILSALRVTGGKLRDQRVLFLGAGSAGVGIADLIASAMTLEGLSESEARARISLFDVHGLLEPSRTDLYDFQKPYAHPHEPSNDFVAVIESQKPTVLIGVSTKGKAFTQAVVEAMARINRRPIIFALSNPTDHAECTAEEAYRWSEGRALYAAGVPFPPVRYGNKTLVPGQGNNLYIFPAVGLAIVATRVAAGDRRDVRGRRTGRGRPGDPGRTWTRACCTPSRATSSQTEVAVAVKVAETIFARRLAGVEKPADVRSFVEGKLYKPEYTSPV